MKAPAWTILAIPQIASLSLGALAAWKARSLPLAAAFLASILAFHAFGLPMALKAGRRAGMGAPRTVILTLALGMVWWGPLMDGGKGGEKASTRQGPGV